MTYKEILPEISLTEFVKCYWWFDNTSDQSVDYVILPDGCFDLIIHFNDRVFTNVELTGLWAHAVAVSIAPGTQLFGIRFKPLAAEYILNRKIAALCNGETKLPVNFWNVDEIPFDDLGIATKYFDKIMYAILVGGKDQDPRKKQLFNLLYDTEGDYSITYYAGKIFWTPRQINRYFKNWLGLPLKAYCTILKCFAALRQIKMGNLYPDQNFFDRAHFIKTLKMYMGNKPSDLYINKNDRFLQLTNLPEK